MIPNDQLKDAGPPAWKWNRCVIPAFRGASGSGSQDMAGAPVPPHTHAHPSSRTPMVRRFAPEDGDELHISMKRTLFSGDPDDKD